MSVTDSSGSRVPYTRHFLRSLQEMKRAVDQLITEIVDRVLATATSTQQYSRDEWPTSVTMSTTFVQELHTKLRQLFPDSSVYFTDWGRLQTGPTGCYQTGPTGPSCRPGPRLIIDWSAP